MKRKISILLSLSLLISCFGFSAVAASPFTPSAVPSGRNVETRLTFEVSKSCRSMEEVSFNKNEFKEVFSKENLNPKGITITALPEKSEGTLTFDGKQVGLYDSIPLDKINKLAFTCLKEDEGMVKIEFRAYDKKTFYGEAAAISINVLEAAYEYPVALDLSVATMKSISRTGFLKGSGDGAVYELKDGPKDGILTISEETGHFIYTPTNARAAKDSFTYYVKDSFGAKSEAATVSVEIKNPGPLYDDMSGHWAHYAASTLSTSGILTGTQVGDKNLFNPEDLISRADFLVMLLTACGMDKNLPASIVTEFKNDQDIPAYLKPYLVKAKNEGIIEGNEKGEFEYKIPITRAEAAKMLDRALKLDKTIDRLPDYSDRDSVPSWAEQSLINLQKVGIMRGYTNNTIRPDEALSRAQTAEIFSNTLDYLRVKKAEDGNPVFNFFRNIFS